MISFTRAVNFSDAHLLGHPGHHLVDAGEHKQLFHLGPFTRLVRTSRGQTERQRKSKQQQAGESCAHNMNSFAKQL
jgi:hypothetical protein